MKWSFVNLVCWKCLTVWYQTGSALQSAPRILSVLPVALSLWVPLSTCHLVNFATLFRYFPEAEMLLHVYNTEGVLFLSDTVASLSQRTHCQNFLKYDTIVSPNPTVAFWDSSSPKMNQNIVELHVKPGSKLGERFS